MQFDRHDRIRSLLTETIASFIREEANTSPLITVTHIRISPDYRQATVCFTTIPQKGEADALTFLKRKGGELRKAVMKRTALKIIPHFTFEVDYGERHRQHIDEIARDIEKNEK